MESSKEEVTQESIVKIRDTTKENKRIMRMAILTLVVIGFGLLFLMIIFMPNKPIGHYEIRLMVWGAVLGIFFIGFMLWLISRAVVMHTAFVIRLRDQLIRHNKSIDKLEKEIKMNGTISRDLTHGLNKAATAFNNLTDELKK